MNNKGYACRVCGLLQPGKPWGDDGKSPTYDICVCCGVEFGLGDENLSGVHFYRNWWINKGRPWRLPHRKPENWDWEVQLQNVPEPFR
jgi:hypothetical protein